MRPGDIFRHERQQKGLSLERASRESKIKPTVLEAIESGETAHIPAVYLKGFVRTYSRYLNVDLSEIEQQLETLQADEPEVRPVFTAPAGRGDAQKWLKVSSYLAASVLIAALAWQFTHEAVRFSQGESPVQSTAQAKPAAGAEESRTDGNPSRTHLNASLANVDVVKRKKLVGSHAAEDAWAALENPVLPEGQHVLALETSADTWI